MTKPNQDSGLAGPTAQRAAPPRRWLPDYADELRNAAKGGDVLEVPMVWHLVAWDPPTGFNTICCDLPFETGLRCNAWNNGTEHRRYQVILMVLVTMNHPDRCLEDTRFAPSYSNLTKRLRGILFLLNSTIVWTTSDWDLSIASIELDNRPVYIRWAIARACYDNRAVRTIVLFYERFYI